VQPLAESLMENKQNIFITSNEPWGPLWFSKQHYAYELAKLGYNVYFINPVKKYSLKNLFSFNVNVQQVPEGLTVISYKNNFPVRLFPRLFIYLNDFLNTWKLKRCLKIKTEKIIWWQFDFLRFINLPFFNKSKRIYHVVDPFMYSSLDTIMAKKADLIVCVNNKYLPYYKNKAPEKRIIFQPHGVSVYDEKKTDKEKVSEIKKKYGDYLFLAGSINNDVSFELLENILKTGYNLLIAGEIIKLNDTLLNKWNNFYNYSNFNFLGVIAGNELKNYIAPSRITIVPYRFDLSKTIVSGSLKIIKYIAQNKAVITSIDSGIPELENKAIYRAKNSDEFLDLIKRAFRSELTVDKTAVEKYLNEHTYPDKIQKILNELDKAVIKFKKKNN